MFGALEEINLYISSLFPVQGYAVSLTLLMEMKYEPDLF